MNIVYVISDQKLLKGELIKTYPDGRVKARFHHFGCSTEEKIMLRERYRHPYELCAIHVSNRGKTVFVDYAIAREESYHASTYELATAAEHYKATRF